MCHRFEKNSAIRRWMIPLTLSLIAGLGGQRAFASEAAQERREPVFPLVTCTLLFDPADPQLWAVMGYDNRNSESVSIPVSAQNFFSPTPIDRGQPTLFAPGKHTVEFLVNFSPDLFEELEWTLDGRKVEININTPRCSSGALALSVAGLGSVSAGTGPACADSCVQTVDPPLALPLTATPAPGWTFVGFRGDPDCDDGQIDMTGGQLRSCQAQFTPIPQRSLALAPLGAGRIGVEGTGITCPPGPCIIDFAENSVLELSAEPEPGAVFLGWLGDENCLSGSPLLDRDTVCVALFDDAPDPLFGDRFESPSKP
jgi:hypothetical protein